MKILHTITCTRYVPSFKSHEQFTRHLTRNRKLTAVGCERILRAEEKEANGDFSPEHPLSVTAIQTAIYQS